MLAEFVFGMVEFDDEVCSYCTQPVDQDIDPVFYSDRSVDHLRCVPLSEQRAAGD